MGKYFWIIYWGIMVLTLSSIFNSVMSSFGSAFLLSVALMPGILLVKYLSAGISFHDKRKAVKEIFLLVAIGLITEYLAVGLVFWYLHRFDCPANVEILTNPFFIWFLLASLLAIEHLLRKGLAGDREPPESYITFTSGRKKVSLKARSVTFVESRDTEVLVWTDTGISYPTRMKISQWDAVLDESFIRVHRSFIVNRGHITGYDSQRLYIGERGIEISRKYRDSVLHTLQRHG